MPSLLPVPIQDSSEDSALAMVLNGALQESELSSACFADEDEAGDMHGIRQTIPRISANAKYGTFPEAGATGAEQKAAPKEVSGIILGRTQNAVHYIPQEKKEIYGKELGYDKLLKPESEKEVKWLCRNPDVANPKSAYLNTLLNPSEQAEAKKIGIGGATGGGCANCTAAQWREMKDGQNFRACTTGENLIWLDSQRKDVVILQMQAGNSVKALGKWIQKTFFKMGRALSLYSYAVKMRFVSRDIGDRKDVEVLEPVAVCPIGSPEQMAYLKSARKQFAFMLESVADADPETSEEHHNEHAPTKAEEAEKAEAINAALDDIV